jgi:hypothetical protein
MARSSVPAMRCGKSGRVAMNGASGHFSIRQAAEVAIAFEFALRSHTAVSHEKTRASSSVVTGAFPSAHMGRMTETVGLLLLNDVRILTRFSPHPCTRR